MCISCRRHVDFHRGEGIRLLQTHVGRERGQKPDFFGRHKWMTPKLAYIDEPQSPHDGSLVRYKTVAL